MTKKNSIYSMTGYASGISSNDDVNITLEIKSVNSKHLDYNFRFPPQYYCYENDLLKILKAKLKRGRVDIFCDRKALSSRANNLKINQELFKSYFEQIKAAFSSVSEVKDIDYSKIGAVVLRRQELFESEADPELLEEERKLLFDSFNQALDSLIEIRAKEGQEIRIKVREQLAKIKSHHQEIKESRDSVVKELYAKLKDKLQAMFAELDFSSERIEQEVAYKIERSDITEEIDRIEMHLSALEKHLEQDVSGKKIDFLISELRREFNTVSAKVIQPDLQQVCIAAKLELEKIKEQAFNLE